MTHYHQHRPFHPFTVELVNGNRIEIDHPGALSLRDGAAVFLATGGLPRIFNCESVAEIIGDLVPQSPE